MNFLDDTARAPRREAMARFVEGHHAVPRCDGRQEYYAELTDHGLDDFVAKFL
jgi:hypothetical protein